MIEFVDVSVVMVEFLKKILKNLNFCAFFLNFFES